MDSVIDALRDSPLWDRLSYREKVEAATDIINAIRRHVDSKFINVDTSANIDDLVGEVYKG